jgi:hypothetical protein
MAQAVSRGAVSLECLEQDANGDRIYAFTQPWSDGTSGIKLSPLERLEKLAALVPLPRVHQGRYGGCLAPHSQLRAAITPTPVSRACPAAPSALRPVPSPWRAARGLPADVLTQRRRALNADQCGVEVEGDRVPTSDWMHNLHLLTSGGFQ